MGRIKEESINGAKWQMLSKVLFQPIFLIFNMILGRIVSPEELGILSLTSIFFAVAEQLKDFGFSAALIRNQERTEEDCSTMFWFNVFMGVVLTAALFSSAPLFAELFNQPALVNLTRVSSVLLFIGSATSVHWALYMARRDFKTRALVGIVCTLVMMPFTIWAAYAGWSYWSVMMQWVGASFLSLIIVWTISPWKPKLIFSFAAFRRFFSFGSKTTAGSLISCMYSESRTFVIGKFYSEADLAYFKRSVNLCEVPISLVVGPLNSVTYPILSTIQNDDDYLISVFRKYMRLASLIILGGMITLAANSFSVVTLLYGDMWVGCVSLVTIYCFGTMFNPLTYLNNNLFMVKGRPDMSLKWSIRTRAIGFLAMIIGAFFSVEGICYAAVVSGFSAMLIATYLTSRISTLKMHQQFQDYLPYLIIALLCNVPSYLLNQTSNLSVWILAPLGCLLSFALYFIVLKIRQDEALKMLVDLAKEQGFPKKLYFWKR